MVRLGLSTFLGLEKVFGRAKIKLVSMTLKRVSSA